MRLQEPKLRTLDEEITRCLDTAEKYEIASKGQEVSDLTRKGCQEVATEQRQLAEWLTDYKELKNSIGAVKLSNMKEALALIRTLKAALNGWREDPFGIIAEVCRSVPNCRRCQWYEKCPFPKNYGSYPEEWRTEK